MRKYPTDSFVNGFYGEENRPHLQMFGTRLRMWVPVKGAELPWAVGRLRGPDSSHFFLVVGLNDPPIS